MVLSIVRQAVQIKQKSLTESPLISEAEYCCACGEALRALGDPDGLLARVRTYQRIEDVQKEVSGLFEKAMEAEENPQRKRLFHLLVSSRINGEITEEIRVLFVKE